MILVFWAIRSTAGNDKIQNIGIRLYPDILKECSISEMSGYVIPQFIYVSDIN
jgi:hypothetical protein